MDKYSVLKDYFGHTQYRPGQLEIIEHILSHKDVLGIMPTGAGKSICYQVPAMLLDGITIVISPLISLMKDQVNALEQAGIKAAYINSSLTSAQFEEVFRLTLNGEFKILYVAPERLLTESFLTLTGKLKISMVTVDEAHCISQWGQDFRPSYLRIVEYVEKLPIRPTISAFTATATAAVRDDIVSILQLKDPLRITTGFDRENLRFEVQKPQRKITALMDIIERNRDKYGIVYCATRKTVEEVCEHITVQGYMATRYHAGLSETERHGNQDDFLFDRKHIMVATNAFGMGIDKSNVSYVVHYNMPKNLESYYQEAGRSGRDGEPAECILLYSGQDVRTNTFLIDQSIDHSELAEEIRLEIKKKDHDRLRLMTIYSTTTGCLREYILRYFGESSQQYCGNCSNCLTHFEEIDITREAQIILACVFRISQRRLQFGKTMIVDMVHGSKNDRIKRQNLDEISAYGLLADLPLQRIHNVIDFLVERKYLALSGDTYPVIVMTQQSKVILGGLEKISMKLPKQIRREKVKRTEIETDGAVDFSLFSKLKLLRNKLASEEHVPAYIIFTDASLKDMCRKLPLTIPQFLDVVGVGKTKAEKYGEQFIRLIQSCCQAV